VPAKEPAVRVKARSTPEPAQAVDVRQPVEISLEEQVRVLNGVPLSPILVGGQPDFAGYGQNPPSEGDSWELDVLAEQGGYEICFAGGCNPHHGILSVYMDGALIGDVDQYSLFNICPQERFAANEQSPATTGSACVKSRFDPSRVALPWRCSFRQPGSETSWK